MMKQKKPRSLFMVVEYNAAPYCGSMFEFKLDESSSPSFTYVANFKNTYSMDPFLSSLSWKFCSLDTATSTHFCLLPDRGPYDFRESPHQKPPFGYIFNISTRKVHHISPPQSFKFFGHALSLNGYIYFIADPYWECEAPEPLFERYNPSQERWESLTPYPYNYIKGRAQTAEMVGHAVLDGFILFNVERRTDSPQLWAYDMSKDKWYLVKVNNSGCYGLQGQAVVLDKTVYSLSSILGSSVLALSVTRQQSDAGDLVFTCSLQSEFTLPYLEPVQYNGYWGKMNLVNLGKHEFCLVESGEAYGIADHQPIRFTVFQLLEGNKVDVTDSFDYSVPLLNHVPIHVRLCFSPLEYVDVVSKLEKLPHVDVIFDQKVKTAPEEVIAILPGGAEVQEETIVNTNSFNVTSEIEEVFAALPNYIRQESVMESTKRKDRAVTTYQPRKKFSKPSLAQVLEPSVSSGPVFPRLVNARKLFYHDFENSILVRNLWKGVTVEQFEDEFRKFGIKVNEIRVISSLGHNSCFVEFENATSVERAIKASTMEFGDCKAVIERAPDDWSKVMERAASP